ncbi:MAG: hypothetical protein JNK00_05190 [Flavipsychrobacter sp.]|nr:hypothetical protein [Flavipsychrobacter sp.]
MQKYTQDIGDTETTDFDIAHNLGTRDVVVSVYSVLTGNQAIADIRYESQNNIKVSFSSPPKAGMFRVVVIG